MKFVIRVDDVGRLSTDSPVQGSDGDLEYFMAWRAAFGSHRFPVTYGVVPSWISLDGLAQLKKFVPGESVAQHGWDHRPGEVSRDDMRRGFEKLWMPRSYIPPFNDYNAETIHHWRVLGGRVLFGGCHGSHHQLGDKPKRVDGLLHIPAAPEFYGRIADMLPLVRTVKEGRMPTRLRWCEFACLTLHVPWETDIVALKAFGDLLVDLTTSVEAVSQCC